MHGWENLYHMLMYLYSYNVYSGIQMNKDNLNKATSLCYQYKAAIGRSLYAILNLQ